MLVALIVSIARVLEYSDRMRAHSMINAAPKRNSDRTPWIFPPCTHPDMKDELITTVHLPNLNRQQRKYGINDDVFSLACVRRNDIAKTFNIYKKKGEQAKKVLN